MACAIIMTQNQFLYNHTFAAYHGKALCKKEGRIVRPALGVLNKLLYCTDDELRYGTAILSCELMATLLYQGK
jgi:hypothetical protein